MSSQTDPHGASPSRTGERVRDVILGAAGGGAVVALGWYLSHRRRERSGALRGLRQAWSRYAAPTQPSAGRRLLSGAVGSLLTSVALEAARTGLQRLVETRAAAREERDSRARAHLASGPSFVTEPVTVDPGPLRPASDTLPPPGIAPPDPLAAIGPSPHEFD